MGVFNNQNTFYNSTWHQYGLPVSGQQLQPIKLEVPKIQFPSYAQQWRQFRNNPFGINSTLLPPPDNTYEPFPINPFSYTNYDPYTGQYDDIYSNGDFRNPVSNQTINNVRMGLNGVTQAIDALGQGRTTGDNDANHYIGMVSKLGSNLPGVWGTLFSGLNFGSSLVNALVGSKLNDQNIKAMDAAIQNRSRYQFGDNSTTDALIAGSQSNVDLAAPGADFYGKDGLLQDWLGYGVGKAHGKAWSNKRLIGNANTQAHNTEALAYKDFQNKMIRRGLLAEPYALGGAINRFDNGGGINTPRTHGSLFNTGLTEINAGGRHSENQFGGVQFGVDQYGIPNLVEEGETVFNAQSYGGPQDYAFSDEIEFPIKEYGHLFSLGGITKRKKGKYKKYTFAYVSKYLAEDIKQNPNSDIVKRTFAENAGKLANIQEEVKAKNMINQMNPMDIMMALQQSPMGEQMVSDTQGSMDQQAMMGQEPIVAACGGKLHSFGGNLFANGGHIFADGGTTYNNTLTGEGDEAYRPPESLAIHGDLFHKAIQEYISDYKQKYDAAVKDKDYQKAVSIASDLMGNLNIAQYLYVNAATNPSKDNVTAMQSYFDELGLNKYVSRFLNDKTRGKNGDGYPVYQKGKAYTKDTSIDGKWGVISQNRFISPDNIAADMLKSMGINSSNFYDSQFIKNLNNKLSSNKAYNIGSYDSAQEYIRKLQGFDLAEAEYYKKVRNPKYTEGGTEPEYIYFADAVAPEGTENTYDWWEGLSDEEKEGYRSKYRLTGDPIRTGPYEWSYIYEPIDGASNQSSTLKGQGTQEDVNASKTANTQANEYYVPKPRNDWESNAALAIAAADYINAMFGDGRNFKSPGADTAYNYLSKVGNIPMVRSTPTGTRMAYRPTDLNFGLNNDRSDMFGLIRTAGNLNRGNAIANDITIMNAGREQMAKTRQQAIEDDLKKLQFVLSNNNQVDQFNAQNSLTAQTTNAQNLARARETQASIASQLLGTLGQNYKNWLDYRNAQSSGLAQMLHDQGYNKQVLNLRDAAFLLNNQQKDALKTAGIPYEVVQDVLNTYKG